MSNKNDKNSIKPQLRTITPLDAEKMLQNNIENRPLKESHVTKIANWILNDEWKITGDTIRFAKSGKLLDGQHRLNAIIEANRSVETLVVYGLEEEMFAHIDTNNIPRTASDVLSMVGASDVTNLASIIRMVHKYDQGVKNEKRTRLTNEDIRIKFIEDANYQKAAIFGAKHRMPRVLNAGLIGAWWYITHRVRPKDANKFWSEISNPLPTISQIALLVRRASQEALRPDKPSKEFLHTFGARAWNAWVCDFELKALKAVKRSANSKNKSNLLEFLLKDSDIRANMQKMGISPKIKPESTSNKKSLEESV